MLLKLTGVSKGFCSGFFRRRSLIAVTEVSFGLARGETLAVIGESGSGKSTLARLALGLLAPSNGTVRFDGLDPAHPTCGQKALRRRLQTIFQDADGSLNPRLTARELLLEPLTLHGLAPRRPDDHLVKLLELVHLTQDILPRHPFELSGGQRQRLGIARAMSLSPELLVADEPTASLDPSVQAHILDILCHLKVEQGLSCLYITHELTTVRFIAERVAVLYSGRIVEIGDTATVLDTPAHPYTKQLVAAAAGHLQCQLPNQPRLKIGCSPRGCTFAQTCPESQNTCHQDRPDLWPLSAVHSAACHAFACN